MISKWCMHYTLMQVYVKNEGAVCIQGVDKKIGKIVPCPGPVSRVLKIPKP